jgi:deazaflavin-dependent oxidoreductase (nitroreductase family)
MPPLLGKILMPLMVRIHRRSGDRFQGNDLLYLTTVGARSGQQRTNPVVRFDDGHGGWFIVASAGGTATHPGWYHNVVAHPDQVWAEFGGKRLRVDIEQLEGPAREDAWVQVVRRSPGFASYTSKTDRTLPILHLTPAP